MATKKKVPAKSAPSRQEYTTASGRRLLARPDTLDFRDQMYIPTLVEVPQELPLSKYRARKVPILDQGQEGACTGFGLATVANFLLSSRAVRPDRRNVSPWMMYDLARQYDEWPGHEYEGSSARGAMKGWHKHGVCAERYWDKAGPTKTGGTKAKSDPWNDALERPLGAYFRVNHKDLVAMHAAITEVGILYATASVHAGWDRVKPNGMITREAEMLGGHAFAIVAYDNSGFWIQNSWGEKWGFNGFGHIRYDDWLANGTDVWVARLGVPVELQEPRAAANAAANGGRGGRASAIRDLRQHIISIGNDGQLRAGGEYGSTRASIDQLIEREIPTAVAGWKKPRLLLFAHGGLVDEQSAIQKVAAYRSVLMENQVYPISFIWKTDYLTTLKNIIEDAFRRRRTEGVLDATKDFLLDRLDDALEPIARVATGKAEWDEMKENAELATTSADGGARIFLEKLTELYAQHPNLEVHIVAHSAGAIFMGHLIGHLCGVQGRKVSTCTLWAPACNMTLFRDRYAPEMRAKRLQRLALYTLTDRAEQDDNCANIYHKSLLYLVAHAFEEKARIPFLNRDGTPIMGMEKFAAAKDSPLKPFYTSGQAEHFRSPNGNPEGSPGGSTALHHGDFDEDRPTLLGTLNRVTGVKIPAGALASFKTTAERRERRQRLNEV